MKKTLYPQDPDPHEDFCPDPQKKCGSETLVVSMYASLICTLIINVILNSEARISLWIADAVISRPTVTGSKMLAKTREVYPTEFRQRGGSYKASRQSVGRRRLKSRNNRMEKN